jgi:hypothetical protein
MDKITIYGLFDPVNDQCRYIGRTSQSLSRRLYQHIRRARKNVNSKSEWINSLLREGLKPSIKIIELVNIYEWQEAERFWIELLHQFGFNLTNLDKGGRGGTRSHTIQWTSETESMLGVISDERIAKKLGVSRKTISYHREKRRIAASWDRSQKQKPPNMGGWNRIALKEQDIKKLGTMPDHCLAEEIGVSKSFITKTRLRLGINSHSESTGQNGRFKSAN